MGEAKTAPASNGANSPAGTAPGLAGLVRGAAEPTQPTAIARNSPRHARLSRKRLLQVSLVLGDLLLLLLAVRLVASVQGRIDVPGAVLCTAAVLAGAWLSCLAFWLEGERDA